MVKQIMALSAILVCCFSCSLFDSEGDADNLKWNRLEMWLIVNGQYVSYNDVEFPRQLQSISQADIYRSTDDYFYAEYERVFNSGGTEITQKHECQAEIDFEHNIINFFQGEFWEYFDSDLHIHRGFNGYDVPFESSGVFEQGFTHYEYMKFKATSFDVCDGPYDISVVDTIVNDGILEKFSCDENSQLIIQLRRDIID